MSNTATAMVKQAQAWVGKKESDGSFKTIIDTYNNYTPRARGYKMKYSDEWCACFASACAIASGNSDVVPLEVSCPQLISLAKQKGIWTENDAHVPTAGDLILYDWQDSGSGDNTGSPDHVGIVEKVSGSTITVIEGNKSEAVGRRNIQVNGRYIRGYICPKYKSETTTSGTSSTTTTTSSEASAITVMAKRVINGKYGNNPARKTNIFNAVQAEVNAVLKNKSVDSEITGLAKAVIQGKYGNGSDRKENLYNAVQSKVNELLK